MFGSFKNMEKIMNGDVQYDNKWITTYSPSVIDPALHYLLKHFNKKP
jgi:hypothetical protein